MARNENPVSMSHGEQVEQLARQVAQTKKISISEARSEVRAELARARARSAGETNVGVPRRHNQTPTMPFADWLKESRWPADKPVALAREAWERGDSPQARLPNPVPLEPPAKEKRNLMRFSPEDLAAYHERANADIAAFAAKPKLRDHASHRACWALWVADRRGITLDRTPRRPNPVTLHPNKSQWEGLSKGVALSSLPADELARGTEHELEHSKSRLVARRTAADHLVEDPAYYTHLEARKGNPVIDPATRPLVEFRALPVGAYFKENVANRATIYQKTSARKYRGVALLASEHQADETEMDLISMEVRALLPEETRLYAHTQPKASTKMKQSKPAFPRPIKSLAADATPYFQCPCGGGCMRDGKTWECASCHARYGDRFGNLTGVQFRDLLLSLADLGDRQLRVQAADKTVAEGNVHSLRSTDRVTVNFINLPKGVGDAGGGAEAENNRWMFVVSGFDKFGDVKVETLRAATREPKLRAKTGSPDKIAKYLADHLWEIVRTVEPKFTHTRMDNPASQIKLPKQHQQPKYITMSSVAQQPAPAPRAANPAAKGEKTFRFPEGTMTLRQWVGRHAASVEMYFAEVFDPVKFNRLDGDAQAAYQAKVRRDATKPRYRAWAKVGGTYQDISKEIFEWARKQGVAVGAPRAANPTTEGQHARFVAWAKKRSAGWDWEGGFHDFSDAVRYADRLHEEFGEPTQVTDSQLQSEDGVVWRSSGAVGHHRRENPSMPTTRVACTRCGFMAEGGVCPVHGPLLDPLKPSRSSGAKGKTAAKPKKPKADWTVTELSAGDKAMIRMVVGQRHVAEPQEEILMMWTKRMGGPKKAATPLGRAVLAHALDCDWENMRLYASTMSRVRLPEVRPAGEVVAHVKRHWTMPSEAMVERAMQSRQPPLLGPAPVTRAENPVRPWGY